VNVRKTRVVAADVMASCDFADTREGKSVGASQLDPNNAAG
jgi:hypothetical protein